MQGKDKLSVKRGRGERGRRGRKGEEREDTVSEVSYAMPDTDLARSKATKKALCESLTQPHTPSPLMTVHGMHIMMYKQSCMYIICVWF